MADHARALRKNGKRADAQRLLEQAWELARSRRGLDDADTLKAASRLRRGLARGGQRPASRAIAEPGPAPLRDRPGPRSSHHTDCSRPGRARLHRCAVRPVNTRGSVRPRPMMPGSRAMIADYRGGVTCLYDTQLPGFCLHAPECGGRSHPGAVRGMPEVSGVILTWPHHWTNSTMTSRGSRCRASQ